MSTTQHHLRTLVVLSPFSWLAEVSPASLRADAVAGLTNTAIAVPQSIAFAQIAGLPPQYGIYTSIFPVVAAALAGSSRQMICGPTSAISAIVMATLAGHFEPETPAFVSAAIQLAFLVGLLQLVFRLLHLAKLASFISHEVVLGFTICAGLVIIKSQLLQLGVWPSDWTQGLRFGQGAPRGLMVGIGMAAATMCLSIVIRRSFPAAPHYLLALAIIGVATYGLNLDVPTVPAVTNVLPPLSNPIPSLTNFTLLLPAALAISLVATLEALSIAQSIAMRSGQTLDPEREFMGQALSNLVGSVSSSYVSSGSFTRSAINFDVGARSPLAGLIAVVVMVLVLLVAAPLVAHIPSAAMSGVILLVAWRLIDWAEIKDIARTSRAALLVLLVTVGAGLIVSLEFAVYCGALTAMAVYIRSTMASTLVPFAPNPARPSRTFAVIRDGGPVECPQLLMTRLQGPLYFGSVDSLRQTLRSFESLRAEQKTLFIRIEPSSGIDRDGVLLLAEESRRRQRRGGALYLSCNYEPLRDAFAQYKLPMKIGAGRIFRRKELFLSYVVPRLDQSICATCAARIFLECPGKPILKNESERTR